MLDGDVSVAQSFLQPNSSKMSKKNSGNVNVKTTDIEIAVRAAGPYLPRNARPALCVRLLQVCYELADLESDYAIVRAIDLMAAPFRELTVELVDAIVDAADLMERQRGRARYNKMLSQLGRIARPYKTSSKRSFDRKKRPAGDRLGKKSISRKSSRNILSCHLTLAGQLPSSAGTCLTAMPCRPSENARVQIRISCSRRTLESLDFFLAGGAYGVVL